MKMEARAEDQTPKLATRPVFPRSIVGQFGGAGEGIWYMERSTSLAAPVSYGLPLEDFKRYYQDSYGPAGMRELPDGLQRVEQTGTSAAPSTCSVFDLVSCNRAGVEDRPLKYREIVDRFCYDSLEHAPGRAAREKECT